MRKQVYAGLILLFLFLLQVKWCTAQQEAVGFRFGSDIGLTLRGNLGKGAIEGIIGSGYRPLQFTVLYERFQELGSVRGLQLYYGGGGYIGVLGGRRWYYGNRHNNWKYREYDYYYREPCFGLAGIIGLEYRFKGTPIAAGVDVKPFLNVYPWFDGAFDAALNLRILF